MAAEQNVNGYILTKQTKAPKKKKGDDRRKGEKYEYAGHLPFIAKSFNSYSLKLREVIRKTSS